MRERTDGVTDPFDIDWTDAADRLAASARSDGDWYRSVAATLVRPGDRVAVDVGCGGGGMAMVLAAALGPGAHVLGIDGAADVLARARELAGGLRGPQGEAARVEFVLADLHHGMAPVRAHVPDGADLIWASASVHHLGDQQGAVDALAGMLRDGGRLALAEGGLGVRSLPFDLGVGEPGLENRLQAAQEAWFVRMRGNLRGSVRMPYGWTEALRRAGLRAVTTRTWLLEQPPPLPAQRLPELVDRFGHRSARLHEIGLISDDDAAAWRRLLDPADDAWLGNRTDLYVLDARSVHVGVR
jgi:SAM-dependent methyltransferase